jgi:hypothetical protein
MRRDVARRARRRACTEGRIMQLRRIAAVTASLSAIGALVGAVLGMLTITALLLATGDPRSFDGASEILMVGAGLGGLFGFILAPVAAWTLMRDVPIWRAVLETTLGTALGIAVGHLAAADPGDAMLWPLPFALTGFAVAALRLRLTRRGPEQLTPRAARTMSQASRVVTVTTGALVMTLASSAVPGTRLEVQAWDCPPAPASCPRPVIVRGFPFPYVSDYHGISPVGSASLSGAILGEDRFRPGGFLANLALYGVVLAAIGAAWGRPR